MPSAVNTLPESSDALSSYWPCRIKIKCLLGAPEGFNRERLLPRLSSSLWSQLQSHWGQGTAGWKSWASMARSATAVSRRWTAGARSSARGRDVGRTAAAPKGRAARRARRCIVSGCVTRAPWCSRSCSAVLWCESCVRALLLGEHSASQVPKLPQKPYSCDSAVRNVNRARNSPVWQSERRVLPLHQIACLLESRPRERSREPSCAVRRSPPVARGRRKPSAFISSRAASTDSFESTSC